MGNVHDIPRSCAEVESNTHEFGHAGRQTTKSVYMDKAFFDKQRDAGIIAAMHDIPHRIADVLLEVEAHLRTNGHWDKDIPPAGALTSTEPFCVDTLRFEQWLQWIFLPRMKTILEQAHPLPAKSGIYEYAQDYFPKGDVQAPNLLRLIKRFDELIDIQQGARRH